MGAGIRHWKRYDTGSYAGRKYDVKHYAVGIHGRSIDQTNLIEKPSFTIYPNPVTDNFILQLNNSHMGKMNVQVVNQSGVIIRSYLFNKDQIVNQITVPANDLPTGIYFIHVQIGTWSDKRKIVKL